MDRISEKVKRCCLCRLHFPNSIRIKKKKKPTYLYIGENYYEATDRIDESFHPSRNVMKITSKQIFFVKDLLRMTGSHLIDLRSYHVELSLLALGVQRVGKEGCVVTSVFFPAGSMEVVSHQQHVVNMSEDKVGKRLR